MSRFKLSAPAREDLREISSYIAHDSVPAARRFVNFAAFAPKSPTRNAAAAIGGARFGLVRVRSECEQGPPARCRRSIGIFVNFAASVPLWLILRYS